MMWLHFLMSADKKRPVKEPEQVIEEVHHKLRDPSFSRYVRAAIDAYNKNIYTPKGTQEQRVYLKGNEIALKKNIGAQISTVIGFFVPNPVPSHASVLSQLNQTNKSALINRLQDAIQEMEHRDDVNANIDSLSDTEVIAEINEYLYPGKYPNQKSIIDQAIKNYDFTMSGRLNPAPSVSINNQLEFKQTVRGGNLTIDKFDTESKKVLIDELKNALAKIRHTQEDTRAEEEIKRIEQEENARAEEERLEKAEKERKAQEEETARKEIEERVQREKERQRQREDSEKQQWAFQQRLQEIQARLDEIGERLDAIQAELTAIGKKLNEIGERLAALQKALEQPIDAEHLGEDKIKSQIEETKTTIEGKIKEILTRKEIQESECPDYIAPIMSQIDNVETTIRGEFKLQPPVERELIVLSGIKTLENKGNLENIIEAYLQNQSFGEIKVGEIMWKGSSEWVKQQAP